MKWKNFYPDNHCFFITSTVNGRLRLLAEQEIVGIFIKNLIIARKLFRFRLFAYVIMPDHWHLLCYFENGSECLAFNRDFKRFSSIEMIKLLQSQSRVNCLEIFRIYANGKAKFSLWKEQARVIPIFNIRKFKQKFDYIHLNPVRAGLVCESVDYKYSSASHYFRDEQGPIELDEISFHF